VSLHSLMRALLLRTLLQWLALGALKRVDDGLFRDAALLGDELLASAEFWQVESQPCAAVGLQSLHLQALPSALQAASAIS